MSLSAAAMVVGILMLLSVPVVSLTPFAVEAFLVLYSHSLSYAWMMFTIEGSAMRLGQFQWV